MSRIFISYRREDSGEICGRIYDWLYRNTPPGSVFQDINAIGPGEQFVDTMTRAVRKAQVVLVVIGPRWFAQPGVPSAYVQKEIEEALRRKCTVVPVLVYGAQMPPANQLPPTIQQLGLRNAHVVRLDPDFQSDMRALATKLKLQVQPEERSAFQPLHAWLALLAAIGLLGIFLGILGSSAGHLGQGGGQLGVGLVLGLVAVIAGLAMFIQLLRGRQWAWVIGGALTLAPGIFLLTSTVYHEIGFWLLALLPTVFLLRYAWSGIPRHRVRGVASTFALLAIVGVALAGVYHPPLIDNPTHYFPSEGQDIKVADVNATANVTLDWSSGSSWIGLQPGYYVIRVRSCNNSSGAGCVNSGTAGFESNYREILSDTTFQNEYTVKDLPVGIYAWSVVSVNQATNITGGLANSWSWFDVLPSSA